jgi:hypothetical protein
LVPPNAPPPPSPPRVPVRWVLVLPRKPPPVMPNMLFSTLSTFAAVAFLNA